MIFSLNWKIASGKAKISLCATCLSKFSFAASFWLPICCGLIIYPWGRRAENTHWYLMVGENRSHSGCFSSLTATRSNDEPIQHSKTNLTAPPLAFSLTHLRVSLFCWTVIILLILLCSGPFHVLVSSHFPLLPILLVFPYHCPFFFPFLGAVVTDVGSFSLLSSFDLMPYWRQYLSRLFFCSDRWLEQQGAASGTS